MPSELAMLSFNLLSGLMVGVFYAVAALGLNFIYGVLRFVNVAHGQFMMLGAYITYWLFILFILPPTVTVVISFFLGYVLGITIFYSVVRRILNAPMMYSLIAAFGISILLEEAAKLLWGPSYRGFMYDIGYVELLGFAVPQTKILSVVINVAIVAALYFFLFKTRFGRTVRSVVQSPEGATLCGVNVNRIYMVAFAMGIGLTVAGGTLSTFFVSSGINPYMGGGYTSLAFVIAVLGGLGSPEGALAGGLIYGVVETLFYQLLSYVPSISPFSMTKFVSFTILLLVLLLRPRGLFGR